MIKIFYDSLRRQRSIFLLLFSFFFMKKIFKIFGIITALSLMPINSFAKCEDAPKMGANFTRCEDDTTICYGFYAEDTLTSPQISCFKK